MASLVRNLQHSLDRFTAKCVEAGIWISPSKSKAMILSRKPMECLLWVGNESLPQVKEFKCLGVLFASEGTMEREIGQRIGQRPGIAFSYRTAVVKRELNRKAKLSI